MSGDGTQEEYGENVLEFVRDEQTAGRWWVRPQKGSVDQTNALQIWKSKNRCHFKMEQLLKQVAEEERRNDLLDYIFDHVIHDRVDD